MAHPPKTQLYKEVLWCPPIVEWIKLNTNGVSCSTPLMEARGGIFRDHNGDHLGSFVCNLGPKNALLTKLMRVIMTTEHAITYN